MSLMNDMLRDLEKRQAPDRTQQVEAQGYGALTYKTEQHASRTIILLLGIIITLLLALAIGWWYLETSPQKGHEAQPSNQVEFVSDKVGAVQNSDALLGKRETLTKNIVRSQEHSVLKQEPVSEPGSLAMNAAEPISDTAIALAALPISEKTQPVEVQPAKTQRNKVQVLATKVDAAPVDIVEKKQAKALANKVLPKKPANENVGTSALSKVLVVSAEQRDENATKAAEELINAGSTQAAKAQLNTFIDANDVDTKSRALLATLLMQDGDMAGANALLTERKLVLSSHLRRLKAHWLAQSGQPDEAIALLNSARPSISADPEYQVLLAALYQQQGFSSDAVAVYAELLSYDPKVADWWAGMAIALDSSQQYPSAKKAYQKALQMEGLRFELADFAKQRLATIGG
ncbi:hypothetical protein [Alkalimarinus alittae]|uniref:MSHA biogenesis protein MshN n=1 Tax=Alkalimarinus alittae TaxID=2961619 RepID=A0ABY6N142_9ALTE|nr:hypothetical protein [Alkalimarinus alittae]UZE95784.1 hypothetical protein NKI27_17270 [Alkalimarinus alittae]